ncbi:MAG: HAD-IC family P-type ATPase [Fimbriimonadaceae bacterium]|nr:HAD-IC family P-type ATPase [Fimbriimonadaceae bacterium]
MDIHFRAILMTQEHTHAPAALPSPAWHSLPPDDVLLQLKADREGLDAKEADARLKLHGPNQLPKAKGESPLQLIWRQINNPLIWVLLGSSGLAMVADPQDGLKNGLVILAVVILNTIIGFLQEFKAAKDIEALTEMVPENSTVLRGGMRVTIPAADLVPGDIVFLAGGDKVPADLRLIQVKNLQVEEAALTGESVPVQKDLAEVAEDSGLGDRTGMAFNGTLVTSGAGTGVVVETGSRTELGKISTLLKEAADLQTPLTKALEKIGKQLTVAILAVAVLMLIVGSAREMITTDATLLDALRSTVIFAIALAVGAIPEGLPAIVTIALAIGVSRMAARRAVVRRLPSVETLGSTTVICSDKTGTLTRNEMTVQALWTPEREARISGVGYEPKGEITVDGAASLTLDLRDLLEAGTLCNDSSLDRTGSQPTIAGDPTEGAMVVAAEKAGIVAEEIRRAVPRTDAIPFESENQFMATLHRTPTGDGLILMKGAPEVVLARSGADADVKKRAQQEVERLAAEGMRVLAVASKPAPADLTDLQMEHVEGGFHLLGLQGMIDPPRPEAIQAIRECHQAGITVKMITGDHKATALAIGRQLGIADDQMKPVTGAEIAAQDDTQLRTTAMKGNVFARVAPEHKLRLVRAIQAENNVVAMTGDGVNDAPALKQANIGVAMGITGTAVTKQAGDLVLTDDNFASIAAAVEEGRRVYDNLVKSLAFVLPTNMGLALILASAVAFFPIVQVAGKPELLLPMGPTQLLWINLVGAVALALPLAFEAKEPNIMNRPPRDPDEPVMNRFVVFRTVLAAVLMTLGAVGLFLYEYNTSKGAGLSELVAQAKAQTMAVTTVIAFQVFYMLNCRSLRDSIFRIGLFSNPAVFLGIGAIVVLQALFIYAPPLQSVFGTAGLSPEDIGKSILAGAVILPVISLEKWWRGRKAAA